MNKLNTILIAIVAVSLLVSGVLTYGGLKSINQAINDKNLGAATGPDRLNQCESRNGITECFTKISFYQATTTPCVIQSPKNATSTLRAALARFQVATSVTVTATWAKSSLPNATTTMLATSSISANAMGTINPFATTTYSVVNQATVVNTDRIFAPGDYLNLGLFGGNGTFSPTGSCQATFETI